MPADLTITSVGNAPAESPSAPARDNSATTSPASSIAAPGPNPVRYFDAASGIVVLEFVSANGNVANTIPTEKQLEAFRRSHDQTAGPVDSAPAALPASPPTTEGSDAIQAIVPASGAAATAPSPAMRRP